MKKIKLLFILALIGLATTNAKAQNFIELIRAGASDAAASDYFGCSVSISGDKAIIGAYGNDDGGSTSGSAYIFELSGGVWTEIQKITASDAAASDYFGYSVSISGDKAIIGAYGNDDGGSTSGSAYIFELSGGVWSETQKLLASDAAATDYFGHSVSISGDRVAIGGPYNDDGGSTSGSAYIFELSGGVWSETQKLLASDAAATDYFGRVVSISGDKAIIGAYGNDDGGSGSGSAYIFELSGGTWAETQKLLASDDASGDRFGWSVAISGNTVTVGATYNDVGGSNSGSTYFYKYCQPVNGTDVQTACDSLLWIDGTTYYANNNTATFNIVGAVSGCDSLVTLDLTIINSVTGTDVQTVCDSLLWIDGNTYYADNNTATFNIMGGAANACDSLVTLNLTINTVNVNVIALDPILTSIATGASYIWLDCDNNYSVIPGQTAQNFIGSSNGDYAVEVTQNGCTDTSTCISIVTITVGIEEDNTLFNNVSIFPNPSRNGKLVNINLGGLKEASINVFNVNGQLIYHAEDINTSIHQFELNEESGIYFVEVSSQGKKQQYKLIKM